MVLLDSWIMEKSIFNICLYIKISFPFGRFVKISVQVSAARFVGRFY